MVDSIARNSSPVGWLCDRKINIRTQTIMLTDDIREPPLLSRQRVYENNVNPISKSKTSKTAHLPYPSF